MNNIRIVNEAFFFEKVKIDILFGVFLKRLSYLLSWFLLANSFNNLLLKRVAVHYWKFKTNSVIFYV